MPHTDRPTGCWKNGTGSHYTTRPSAFFLFFLPLLSLHFSSDSKAEILFFFWSSPRLALSHTPQISHLSLYLPIYLSLSYVDFRPPAIYLSLSPVFHHLGAISLYGYIHRRMHISQYSLTPIYLSIHIIDHRWWQDRPTGGSLSLSLSPLMDLKSVSFSTPLWILGRRCYSSTGCQWKKKRKTGVQNPQERKNTATSTSLSHWRDRQTRRRQREIDQGKKEKKKKRRGTKDNLVHQNVT